MISTRRFVFAATCLFLVAAATSCEAQDTRPEIVNRPRAGGLDVTFLLAADLHFGAAKTTFATSQSDAIEMSLADINARMIDQMNAIAGREYPMEIGGGKISQPRALLIAGDLTEAGMPEQWNEFVKLYGRDGTDARLAMPVFESVGNHDCYNLFRPVSKAVRKRHGQTHYSWDVGDLHIVCLGEPDEDALRFVRKDLPGVGLDRPIIIYFHYSIVGPYSDDYWFGKGKNRERFAAVIKGFNVIGLFHGHFHGSGYYRWNGYDVYDVGSPKHNARDFFVIRVTDDRMTVCSWNYEATPGWWWAHSKPINAAARRPGASPIMRTWPHARIGPKWPMIPHPTVDLSKQKR